MDVLEEPLLPGMESEDASCPYFEVLVVAGEDPGTLGRMARTRSIGCDARRTISSTRSWWRTTSRMHCWRSSLNADIQAVVAYEGFRFHSKLDLPDLERFLGADNATTAGLRGRSGNRTHRPDQGRAA